MILKNLWRRKTRTLLTLLGIAVGVAAVVAFSAFGEGMATGFEKTFTTAAADLMVGQKDAVILMLSNVDDQVGDELEQMPGVAQVAGTVIGLVTLPDAPYFVVMGQDPRGFAIEHYRLIEGQPLSGRKQILLGKIAAKNFKKQVGDTFRLNDLNYRVVGIYETGVSFEDGGAVMGLEDAQRAFDKKNQVSYYGVKLKDARRADEIKKAIEARWPDLTATRSGEPTTQTEALQLYRSFGWFLGIFAVLVGGLGMMNTMLMSVLERTREIGVLRAVGWRRRRIVGMILGEALMLGLLGGLLGIALGVGLTRAAQLIPAVETLLHGIFTPMMFVQAIVVALLLGAVGGVLPAWRAARLEPVEAMRAEGSASVRLGTISRVLSRLVGSSALRNLWRRPTRTWVTLIGIGIGVGFIVALLAITEGFAVLFAQLGGAGQADLMAEQAGVSDASLSTIDERTVDRLAHHPEVKAVSKLLLNYSTAPGVPYFILFGLDPREDYIKHFRVREGRMLERSREIIVGRFAANGLKKKVGDMVRIGGTNYRLVGIYENGSAFEDAGGVILLKDAQQQFNKPRQVSFLGIAVKDVSRVDEIARRLEREFPEIMVAKPTEFTDRMQDMQTTYAILNALIGLTLVVGGIVMMNVMLMSVFERTQEIGVLRALGWRRHRILRAVLVESLALSTLSAIVGIALGVGLAYLFSLAPGLGQFLIPAYTPEMFVQVFVLALVLGTIGGLYPAWRAANLRPVEALRYE